MNTSLTITVHYTSESLMNEWPLVSLYAICYSLSSRTRIFSKITYSRYRYNVVHYSTILNTALKWASCQIRKIAGCACAGNAGNVFPHRRFRRKPLVSDPGMHHGTCLTHVPWCMSESLIRDGGENVPGIPGACAARNFAYLARGPWLR